MKREIIGRYKVDFYEYIDEMPIVRHNAYNLYLLIDSGVGSTTDEIDLNIDKVANYVQNEDKENAIKQLMLLKQNLYFVRTGENPEFLAFVCLIHSINGEELKDLSIENLNRIIDKFKNYLTPKRLRDILYDIKKKVEEELETHFPNLVDSPTLKEYYGKLKQRTILVCREITEKADLSAEIYAIDKFLTDSVKPGVFYGKDSLELKYQREFEEMCFIMNQNLTNQKSKEMNVLEFYTALEVLRRQRKKTKNNKVTNKKHNVRN